MEYWKNTTDLQLDGEVWKPIKGYKGYQVSNLGRVKSFHNHRVFIRKQHYNEKGYLLLQLEDGKNRKTIRVHRLVAQAFLPSYRDSLDVDHINSQRDCNVVSNLRCITHKENINSHNRGVKHGLSIGKPVLATNLKTGQKLVFLSTISCAQGINGKYQNVANSCTGGYSVKGWDCQYIPKDFEIEFGEPLDINTRSLETLEIK